MKKIKKLVHKIEAELDGAQDYAENYIEAKAKDDGAWASRYKQMAQDELTHAGYIHEKAVAEIQTLSRIYTPPEGMEEKWEKAHKKYVDRAAFIKQMLTM